MKSYKIHLIRHGLTDANAKGVYLGRSDWPLSPTGLTDLLKKKEEAVYPEATAFFTAPLTRCRQTLKVLYPHADPVVIDGLTECDFGEFEGKGAAELQNNPAFTRWMTGEDDAIPGGENAAAFQARVMQTFESTVQQLLQGGKTEAVICAPGGVIMLIMAAYALPQCNLAEWQSEPGCGFTLRVTPTLWMRQPVAEAIDMIPHILQE